MSAGAGGEKVGITPVDKGGVLKKLDEWIENTRGDALSVLFLLESHGGKAGSDEERCMDIGKYVTVLDRVITKLKPNTFNISGETDIIVGKYMNTSLFLSTPLKSRLYVIYSHFLMKERGIEPVYSRLTPNLRDDTDGDSLKDDAAYLEEIEGMLTMRPVVVFFVGIGHLPGLMSLLFKSGSYDKRSVNFHIVNLASVARTIHITEHTGQIKFYQHNAPPWIDLDAIAVGRSVEEKYKVIRPDPSLVKAYFADMFLVMGYDVGSNVTILGLTSDKGKLMNDKKAVVGERLRGERQRVKLEDTGEIVNLKLENIKPFRPPGGGKRRKKTYNKPRKSTRRRTRRRS